MFPSGETIPNVISIAFFAILLAGAIQVVCGATRMANIVKNIPYPVIAGFINSSALLIILGQSWTLLDIRRQDSLLTGAAINEVFGLSIGPEHDVILDPEPGVTNRPANVLVLNPKPGVRKAVSISSR